jgi:hypothetical protein
MALILPKLSYDQSRPGFFGKTYATEKRTKDGYGIQVVQSKVQRRALMNIVMLHFYEYKHNLDNMMSTTEVNFNNTLEFSIKYLCVTWLNASV